MIVKMNVSIFIMLFWHLLKCVVLKKINFVNQCTIGHVNRINSLNDENWKCLFIYKDLDYETEK